MHPIQQIVTKWSPLSCGVLSAWLRDQIIKWKAGSFLVPVVRVNPKWSLSNQKWFRRSSSSNQIRTKLLTENGYDRPRESIYNKYDHRQLTDHLAQLQLWIYLNGYVCFRFVYLFESACIFVLCGPHPVDQKNPEKKIAIRIRTEMDYMPSHGVQIQLIPSVNPEKVTRSKDRRTIPHSALQSAACSSVTCCDLGVW